MTVQSPQRSIVRAGLASLLVGLGLAATGFVAAPVQAKPADPPEADHNISICHATGNGGYSNPTPTALQILDDAHGHGLHLDDIIPPFPAGSQGANSWAAFPGRNWDAAGRAIYDACSPCKTGTHDELGDCTVPDPDPEVCAEGQVGVFPECVTPDPDPEPQVPLPVLIPPLAVTPVSEAIAEHPTRLPIEVLGEQVLAAPTNVATVQPAVLPRTGTDTVHLVQFGIVLILLGAGAVALGLERRRALPVVVLEGI